jgi:hypothetical protein
VDSNHERFPIPFQIEQSKRVERELDRVAWLNVVLLENSKKTEKIRNLKKNRMSDKFNPKPTYKRPI